MLAASMRPSTVKGRSQAVTPISPCVLYQLVRMPVRDDRRDRRDGGHGERGGDPDEPVRHRNSSRSAATTGLSLPRPLSSNSVTVSAVIAWLQSKNRGQQLTSPPAVSSLTSGRDYPAVDLHTREAVIDPG
jgi:hypothetical protein